MKGNLLMSFQYLAVLGKYLTTLWNSPDGILITAE